MIISALLMTYADTKHCRRVLWLFQSGYHPLCLILNLVNQHTSNFNGSPHRDKFSNFVESIEHSDETSHGAPSLESPRSLNWQTDDRQTYQLSHWWSQLWIHLGPLSFHKITWHSAMLLLWWHCRHQPITANGYIDVKISHSIFNLVFSLHTMKM